MTGEHDLTSCTRVLDKTAHSAHRRGFCARQRHAPSEVPQGTRKNDHVGFRSGVGGEVPPALHVHTSIDLEADY